MLVKRQSLCKKLANDKVRKEAADIGLLLEVFCKSCVEILLFVFV